MFFEADHSLKEFEFRLFYGKTMDFPLHIHRSFEYFEQIEGSTEVTVGERKYLLEAGEAVLVFPLQPHAYRSICRGAIRLCIFSPDLVADFYQKNENRLPTDNKLCCELPWNDRKAETLLHQKALAYFICGEFERGRAYEESGTRAESRFLVELLLFAERNFASPCLLRDAAAEIGYDYAYASRFFKQRVGISFRQYVNGLRVTESKRLLGSTARSIEEIGAACGFSSLRVFDREFRAQTGISPSEYRKTRRKT